MDLILGLISRICGLSGDERTLVLFSWKLMGLLMGLLYLSWTIGQVGKQLYS